MQLCFANGFKCALLGPFGSDASEPIHSFLSGTPKRSPAEFRAPPLPGTSSTSLVHRLLENPRIDLLRSALWSPARETADTARPLRRKPRLAKRDPLSASVRRNLLGLCVGNVMRPHVLDPFSKTLPLIVLRNRIGHPAAEDVVRFDRHSACSFTQSARRRWANRRQSPLATKFRPGAVRPIASVRCDTPTGLAKQSRPHRARCTRSTISVSASSVSVGPYTQPLRSPGAPAPAANFRVHCSSASANLPERIMERSVSFEHRPGFSNRVAQSFSQVACCCFSILFSLFPFFRA